MPTTAKVARIYEYGPPEVLKFEQISIGEPGDDEALVRNTVIGLNFVDVYYRRGSLPVSAFPATLGDEAAGIVEAVGKNVKNVSVGDRVVYGDVAFGAYTTARLYAADRLIRIPADVTDDQAASAFLKGLTARYLLKEVVSLRAGDTILYHAAAGGVGQIFVQWAKSLGLKVIGTVSTDTKANRARIAGCDHVINYLTADFVAETFALTRGEGVTAVFDSVGKDTFRGSLAVLRPRGTLVQFGQASGSPDPIDPAALAPRALHLTWPILPRYTTTAEELAVAAADLFDAITSGSLNVDASNLYPFDQLVQAHHDLEERRTTGAAVLRVTEGHLS
jgi:NADPH:quinone reductase